MCTTDAGCPVGEAARGRGGPTPLFRWGLELAIGVALLAIAALAAPIPQAAAHHVTFDGASVSAREIAPAADGSPRVRVSWEIRCSGAQHYGAGVFLYSHSRGGPIATVVLPGVLPATGDAVTGSVPEPGWYRPFLVGPACFALVGEEDAHTAVGPQVVEGPDFEIKGPDSEIKSPDFDPCPKPRVSRARSSGTWPLIPVPGGGGCVPNCEPTASASRAAAAGTWPLIPVPGRERCAPEQVTKRNQAPVPVNCPPGGSARGWPLLPARGPCDGEIELKTAKPTPCALRAAWPVIPCRLAVRRKRITLGSTRFRLRAGRAAVVLVKLRRNARRLVNRRKSVRVRALITLRKGKRRARTVRTFTLRAR